MDINNNIISKITIVNFYKNKLMDIFTSFFVKFFIQIKNENNILQLLENIQKDIENDKIYDKFSSYLKRKYDLNLQDIELALYIFYKEYLQQLLNTKLNIKKQKDILYTFFIKCCKKNAKELYNFINGGNLLSSTTIFKIVHTNINNMLDDIIPIEIMNYNYNYNFENLDKHHENVDNENKNNEKENYHNDNKNNQNQLKQKIVDDNVIDDNHVILSNRCVQLNDKINSNSNINSTEESTTKSKSIKNTIEKTKSISDVKNDKSMKMLQQNETNSTTTLDTDTEIIDDSYNSFNNISHESSNEKIITIPVMNNLEEPKRKRKLKP